MTRFSYERLAKHPRQFSQITGLKVAEFQELILRLRPVWTQEIIDKKKLSGRPWGVGELENHLLCLLLYYRCYTTQLFISFWFGVADSTVTRSIKRLEKLLIGVVAIKKDRTLSEEALKTVLVDCTEQRIEQPKRGQKKYYSGKRKAHTIKTEILVNEKGRILSVSRPAGGKKHDLKVRLSGPAVSSRTQLIGDSGYQGLQHTHAKTCLPYKKPRKQQLDKAKRFYNRMLSSFRMGVENAIRRIKIFRIIKEQYRNKRIDYALKFNIVAGLTNFKLGY